MTIPSHPQGGMVKVSCPLAPLPQKKTKEHMPHSKTCTELRQSMHNMTTKAYGVVSAQVYCKIGTMCNFSTRKNFLVFQRYISP